MRDDSRAVGGAQHRGPDRKLAADLHQAAFGDHVAGRRLAHEVDRHVGGHRQPDRPDLRQDGRVERDVGQQEHRGSRNGPAGPQVPVVMEEAQPARHRPDLLHDHHACPLVDQFGKIAIEEGVEVGGAHRGSLGHDAAYSKTIRGAARVRPVSSPAFTRSAIAR